MATPIGNLEDVSQRAANILKNVGIIACEDTRHSATLLRHVGVSGPRLVSLHEHNEGPASDRLIDELRGGVDVAVISDAGTPLVCDPGFELVRAAWAAGLRPVPVPGPSALLAALSVSPIALQDFQFIGFLPAKEQSRRMRLAHFLASCAPFVFFETAPRFLATARQLQALNAGGRAMFVARELTKRHESLYFGAVDDIAREVESAGGLRGEFVCVVEGESEPPDADAANIDRMLKILLNELKPTQASRLAAKITGQPRRRVYARALELTPDGE